MKQKYKIVVGDGINQRTYHSNIWNAKKAAMEYGHARAGETVTVYKIVRKDIPERLYLIGCAIWNEEHRKYVKVLVKK